MIIPTPPCPTCGWSLASKVKDINETTISAACNGCGKLAIFQRCSNQAFAKNPPEIHKRRKPILPPPWLREDAVKQKGLKDA